jgi:hypothetical protein
MTVLPGTTTCLSTAGAARHHDHSSQPASDHRPTPPARQPDAALVTAGAVGQHWRIQSLLTLPAWPPACDRHAEPRTPELADLREAARTDGAGIGRTESAI